jgi:hypothetical protein
MWFYMECSQASASPLDGHTFISEDILRINMNLKSNSALVTIALLSLMLAVISSVVIWGEVSSAVKIGMFALGFSAGVAVGAWIARRSRQEL